MAVINGLALSLFSITFAGLLLLYFLAKVCIAVRSKQKNLQELLNGIALPLGVLGSFITVSGLWNMLTWPITGSYNILFYDPYVALGLLLVAFAIGVRYRIKLEYLGFWSLLAGIMTLVYGLNGYNLGMSSSPIALLGLYSFFGIAAVLAWPITYLIDRLPGRNRLGTGWSVVLALFALALIGAVIVAGLISISAVSGHLAMYATYVP
jgi:putative membrane protein